VHTYIKIPFTLLSFLSFYILSLYNARFQVSYCLLSSSGLVYLAVIMRSGSADQLSIRVRGGFPLIQIQNLPVSGEIGWESGAARDFVRFSAVSS